MMESHLTLRSHGEEARYRISSAVYVLAEDGRLSFSVEAVVADPENESVPRDLSLALWNVRYGPGQSVRVLDEHDAWGERDSSPHAYVYSGFHHSRVDAHGTVTALAGDRLAAELTINTDDVRFYDERATESVIEGRIVLGPGSISDLWAP